MKEFGFLFLGMAIGSISPFGKWELVIFLSLATISFIIEYIINKKEIKWSERKQVKNIDIIILTILSCFAGFIWAYLHWGKGIPW